MTDDPNYFRVWTGDVEKYMDITFYKLNDDSAQFGFSLDSARTASSGDIHFIWNDTTDFLKIINEAPAFCSDMHLFYGKTYYWDIQIGSDTICFDHDEMASFQVNNWTSEDTTSLIIEHDLFPMGDYPSGSDFADTILLNIADVLGLKENNVPTKHGLLISPNPFNSMCRISTPENSVVEIFDIEGRKVSELGGGNQIWKPEASVGSGVYLVRAKIGDKDITKRVVYLK